MSISACPSGLHPGPDFENRGNVSGQKMLEDDAVCSELPWPVSCYIGNPATDSWRMTIANGEAITVVLPPDELYIDLKGTYDQTEEDQLGRKSIEAHDGWVQPAGHNAHGRLSHAREGAQRVKEELQRPCVYMHAASLSLLDSQFSYARICTPGQRMKRDRGSHTFR